MSSTSFSRPRQRAAQWPRALGWAAAALSVLLHGEVFWRLWSYAPDPRGVGVPQRQPQDEWEISFDAPQLLPMPLPVPLPPMQSTVDAAAVVEAHRRSPSVPLKRKRRHLPVASPAPAHPAAASQTLTAADLQAQVQGTSALAADDWTAAAQRSPLASSSQEERDARVLDLTVRAGPGGVKGAVSAVAAMMSAPTRGDTERVGDIHSAMLVNKWIGQHHGELFRGCDKQQRGETMATFVERCPPQSR